jgi:hypothetical protein
MRSHTACITVLLLVVLSTSLGCVRRTLRISSTPPGALVWVNHREVGRTPLEIDFTYYGHYDVQVTRDGSEPIITTAQANPPVWDVIGLDLVFDVMPFEAQSVVEWHFDLEPRDDDLDALVDRARSLRSETNPEAGPPVVTLGEDGEIVDSGQSPD